MSTHQITPLGRKILAAILGTTLLALVLSFVLNLVPMALGYRQNTADKASAQAELMAASLSAAVDFEDAQAAHENLETLSLIPSVTGAAIFVYDGALFAEYGTPPNYVPQPGLHLEQSLNKLIVSCPIPAQNKASVVLAVSLDEQWSALKGYLAGGAVILVAIFLVCFKIAGLFRRKLGDPLEELTGAVRQISHHKDYTKRVDYSSNDEIGMLVAEFNTMLEKIEERDARLSRHGEELEDTVQTRTAQLQAKQHELLHNNRLLLNEIKKRAQAEMIREEVERINRHDLKSSLSLVIGYPEILLSEGGLSADQEKKVKRIRAAGYRMLDMIRNHLNMFKMENGIYALNRSSVDLVEIVCNLEEEFAPLLANSGVRLSIEMNGREVVGDEEFIVVGEGPLLRTMCRNMIQNGIEASGQGDTVKVEFHSRGNRRVAVSNPAVVPKEIRRRFFDKYVTYGKENGTGLGTFIVALIAKTHHASVTLKSNESEGTRVTVHLAQAPIVEGDQEDVVQPRAE